MIQVDEYILKLFRSKINLLIVDDDPVVLDSIKFLFSSPLFNIMTGSDLKQALEIINSAQKPWHCWILDIALDEEDDGFKILRQYPQFPFSVMLSGLRSMTTATQAMQNGAMKVFDKDPHSISLLHDEVCKIASLGFVLNGKGTQYLKHYTLIKENIFATPKDWAVSACITVRQLERICSMHSPLTPKYVLSLFYTLYGILKGEYTDSAFKNHFDFFEKHLEKYQKLLVN